MRHSPLAILLRPPPAHPSPPVPLTQTKKKTRDNKERLVGLVRDCVDECAPPLATATACAAAAFASPLSLTFFQLRFATAYVFRYENMRNATLKELRDKLHGSARCAPPQPPRPLPSSPARTLTFLLSSFFLGSNKVLQVALGRSEGEEHRPGLASLSARLRGGCGLVFTSLTREELETSFADCCVAHWARAGCVASETVEMEAGPLFVGGGQLPFPHTQEPALRAAGVPCRLRAGVVELLGAHTVCEEGKPLNAHQAAVLKMLNIKLATFNLELDSVWESNGAFEVLSEPAEETAAGAAAAFEDDGDFTFGEVEVDSDDERAVRARKGGKGGKKAEGKKGGAAAAAEDEDEDM